MSISSSIESPTESLLRFAPFTSAKITRIGDYTLAFQCAGFSNISDNKKLKTFYKQESQHQPRNSIQHSKAGFKTLPWPKADEQVEMLILLRHLFLQAQKEVVFFPPTDANESSRIIWILQGVQ
ncbi:hypothetical protein AVEN_227289-1 [Araneus ventricosus]|uniref:Uncharacterized protein n=1 Tax=Araneus ventricosus TaxID=182803 RepID=A0A4Y2HFR0_ARAVE|nr:hypothetical protein AVEN_227289-1 [Araneus ventricosus]